MLVPLLNTNSSCCQKISLICKALSYTAGLATGPLIAGALVGWLGGGTYAEYYDSDCTSKPNQQAAAKCGFFESSAALTGTMIGAAAAGGLTALGSVVYAFSNQNGLSAYRNSSFKDGLKDGVRVAGCVANM